MWPLFTMQLDMISPPSFPKHRMFKSSHHFKISQMTCQQPCQDVCQTSAGIKIPAHYFLVSSLHDTCPKTSYRVETVDPMDCPLLDEGISCNPQIATSGKWRQDKYRQMAKEMDNYFIIASCHSLHPTFPITWHHTENFSSQCYNISAGFLCRVPM